MAPVAESACKIPTEAEELWIIAVTIAPTSTPNMGFCRVAKTCANSGTAASGFTAASIVNIPVKRTEKPSIMVPISLYFAFLPAIRKMMPTTAMIGARVVGLSRLMKKFAFALLSKSPILKICAVTVVPIFAPIITPIQERSFKIPALTSPTTITVVAEELWMAAVTSIPSRTPFQTLFVSFSRVFSIRPPESFSRLFPRTFIPNKKRASPPPSDTIRLNQSIRFPHKSRAA